MNCEVTAMKMNVVLVLLAVLLMVLPAAAEAPVLSNIPAADESLLNAVANVEGGPLAFTNPTDPAIWPMLPAEEDGFACLTSTNWGVDDSVSAVYTRVEAQAGDVLSFCFKTSLEAGYDMLQLSVNGEAVKVFTGQSGWRQYAWAFPADGVYDVGFLCSKDGVSAEGADAVYIRDVQLLTGAEAALALAANPAWPLAEARTLQILNAGAREIIFDDPTFALTGLHGLASYFIVPEETASVWITLAQGDDPDGAVLTVGSDVTCVTQGAATGGYAFDVPLVSGTSYIMLIPERDCGMTELRTVICFSGEDAADEMLRTMQGNGYRVQGWRYAGEPECTVTVIDQQGEFVEGVTVGVTTETGTERFTSDADGMIVIPAAAGTVRIVGVPDGYDADPERVWTMEGSQTELILDVARAGE